MNAKPKHNLLCTTRLPARLRSEEAASILGFEVHDLPTLVAAGLLRPLGNPTKNAPKRFAAADLDAKAADVKWLNRAEIVIARKWRNKNARRPDEPA